MAITARPFREPLAEVCTSRPRAPRPPRDREKELSDIQQAIEAITLDAIRGMTGAQAKHMGRFGLVVGKHVKATEIVGKKLTDKQLSNLYRQCK